MASTRQACFFLLPCCLLLHLSLAAARWQMFMTNWGKKAQRKKWHAGSQETLSTFTGGSLIHVVRFAILSWFQPVLARFKAVQICRQRTARLAERVAQTSITASMTTCFPLRIVSFHTNEKSYSIRMRIFMWFLLTFDVSKTNFQSHTYTERRNWQLANVNII